MEDPVFAWWTKHVLNKRDKIISRAQRYWIKKQKYRLRLPKTVKESVDINKYNGDTLWWDAIMQEMENIGPAFEVWGKRKYGLPIGYQEIKFHIIFDIKLGKNFRRKSRLIRGGHTTTALATITYSSVVLM